MALATSPRILVIDDDDAIRDYVREILSAQGYEALTAADGNAGVDVARRQKPSLILCDINMPELNGYDVLAHVRKDPLTASIPFIFMTGLGERADIRSGMNLGADDYLTKPFSETALLGAVRARLGKQALIHAHFQKQLEELRASMALAIPHEFLTPLTAVLGFTDVLLDGFGEFEPDEVRTMLTEIRDAGQQLHRIVRKYILYAELELAARTPERLAALRGERARPVEPHVAEAARRKAGEAGRSGDLRLDLPDTAVALLEGYLKALAEELVENALRYSAPGTPVSVTGSVAGGRLTLEVRDRGRGMTPEQLSSIGAYVQFERRVHEQQGSGLGLSIARRIADLHGGSLSVESVSGSGTTVRVTLPAAVC